MKQVRVNEDGASGSTFTIGTGLPPDQEKALVSFLRTDKDVFAWEPKDLVGIPRGVIEHHLRVCPNARLVKQKAQRQSMEKQSFVVQETRKLQEAGVIREARTIIEDLEETFASMRKVDLRLNPEKCVFGVPSGKLLGFLVSHTGIEANPEKVKAIERMSPPQAFKGMQKLVGCVTSLGCFISKLLERALPFFKLRKWKGPFEWTLEADVAFQDLKRYLTSPPVMVAPRPLEPLVLYLASMPRCANAALVPQDGAPEAPTIPPVNGAPKTQVNPSDNKAPEATTALTDNKAPEYPLPLEVQDPTDASSLVEHPAYFVSTVLRDVQALYPMLQKLFLALLIASRKLRHYFQGHPIKVSNNIAVYEGLITGLKATAALGVRRLTIRGDLQLLFNFSNNKYKPKDEHMEAYLKEEWLFKPSVAPPAVGPATPQEELPPAPLLGAPACGPTSGARLLLALEPQEGCWTEEFKAYLLWGTLPEKEEDAERVARKATTYYIRDGELYRSRPNDVSLRCISNEQECELLADIHGGDCGHHSSSRTLMGKVFGSRFY
ncbi:uncharacterized protein [Aegilops tauschii subsp. strangulata]|uniref:uncharacterized protein n=1 Tax=Aegilops tauschii subsp. strangulata TaxID=200361 RepID=UPI003CC8DB05